MKKLMLIALVAASSGVQAAEYYTGEDQYYAGANLGTWKYREHPFPDAVSPRADFNLTTLEGFAGYRFHKYLSVEARLGVGIEADTAVVYDINNESHNVYLDYFASAYLRPELRNETAKFYGLLGVSTLGATHKLPTMPNV